MTCVCEMWEVCKNRLQRNKSSFRKCATVLSDRPCHSLRAGSRESSLCRSPLEVPSTGLVVLAQDVRAELHSCTMAWLEPVLDGLPQEIIAHVEIRAALWHRNSSLFGLFKRMNSRVEPTRGVGNSLTTFPTHKTTCAPEQAKHEVFCEGVPTCSGSLHLSGKAPRNTERTQFSPMSSNSAKVLPFTKRVLFSRKVPARKAFTFKK